MTVTERRHSDDHFTQRCLDLFEGVLLTPRQEQHFKEGAWLLCDAKYHRRARKPQPKPPWQFW